MSTLEKNSGSNNSSHRKDLDSLNKKIQEEWNKWEEWRDNNLSENASAPSPADCREMC